MNPSSLCYVSLLDELHRLEMSFSIDIIQKLRYSSFSSLDFVLLFSMFVSNGSKGFQAFMIWCFQIIKCERTWLIANFDGTSSLYLE